MIMPDIRTCLMLGLAVAITAYSGCVAPDAPRASSAISRSFDEIYARTLAEFELAAFFKPREGSMRGIEADLAPLIVQQVTDQTPEAVSQQRFGALVFDDRGYARVDTTQPTVYTNSGTVMIAGVEHRMIGYSWYYPVGAEDRERATASVRTVRLVLDTEGFPLLCLVQGPVAADSKSKGPQILFVSASLELRAAEEFGPPLPGRRYSIERSLEEAPNTVVARVFEDGPVPMGPYIYLEAGTHGVTTAHCRCSPSQVSRFVNEGYYELQPAQSLGTSEHKSSIGASHLSLGVEKMLRWPGG